MSLRGTHDHNLDAKNRLTVPSKLRHHFADGVVVAKGVDDCLGIWPEAAYGEMVDEALAKLNRVSPEGRRMKRFFNSQANTTELDSAGRVMIPSFLLGTIGREVVVSGAGECLEVWSREAWAIEEPLMLGEIDELTSRLGHVD